MYSINHIGLIPDGARRWARKNNIDLYKSYEITVENVIRFIRYSLEFVNEISIYLLSRENLQRNPSDIEPVFSAEYFLVNNLLPQICDEYSIKIIHAGTKSLLPSYFSDSLDLLCQKTSLNIKSQINLLIAYNPLDEINSALSRGKGKLDLKNLWVPNMVDLVIRTAGGSVIQSNFLPLQCGYSHAYIVDVFFNDFTRENFINIYETAKQEISMKGK